MTNTKHGGSTPPGSTKIVATSDLHGFLPKVPEADILVVAGDISPIDYDRDRTRVMNWVRNDFTDWIMEQPVKHRLVIAGNHDYAFEDGSWLRDIIDTTYEYGWTYLLDEFVKVEEINFYGIPWIPNLHGWPFYASAWHLMEAYEAVPNNTNVVISHGPPKDYLDNPVKQYGCTYVNDMIRRVKPKVFICGHIHEGYGETYLDNTRIYNVSHCDLGYNPINQPRIIEIKI